MNGNVNQQPGHQAILLKEAGGDIDLKRNQRRQMRALRMGLLFGVFWLLAGCSVLPELTETDNETVWPLDNTQPQASFNKPYKVRGKVYVPLTTASGYKAQGTASWYGAESGRRTASGERFNPSALTAAHKTLPIPSKVRVTNLRNGRHVDVVINDRGPFTSNRLIDLSKAAAEHIGMRGLDDVSIESLEG